MALSKSDKMRLFQRITDWSTDKMRANKKAIHDIVCDGNAITYTEQNLTEEQKAQARENINAANDSEVVKHVTQNLTSEQKVRARENIGAGDAETVQELDEKVNGHDTNGWVEIEPAYIQNHVSLGIRKSDNEVCFITTGASDYKVFIYQIEKNTRYRFSAAKHSTAFGSYSASGYRASGTNRSLPSDTIGVYNKSAGTIVDQEDTFTQTGYLFICGNSSVPPKCEIWTEIHIAGLDGRVESLEENAEMSENKVQTLDGNESDETKYPSTKAVYDGIHPKIVTEQPQNGFISNIFYNLGELTGNITFSFATPSDATVANHYYWTFDTGATAPTITWPNGITWVGGSVPEISANKHYEISVLNGIGMFIKV